MKFLDLLSILHKDPNLIEKLSGHNTSKDNLQTEPESVWNHAILLSTAINNKEHEKAYGEFNEFYNSIMSDNKELETVLQAHLLIEFYIRKFINLYIGYQPNNKQLPERFGFSSMIELLKCIKELSILPWLKSLTELNRIRNKYAHNISYEVKENDVKEICKFIKFRKSLDDASKNKIELEEFENYIDKYKVDTSNLGQCIKEYAFFICEMLHFDIYNYSNFNKHKKYTLDIDKVINKDK